MALFSARMLGMQGVADRAAAVFAVDYWLNG